MAIKTKIELINEADFISTMQTKVEPYLEERRTQGFFNGFDGKKLYYENYVSDEARACVVMVHGFTEFCEKYREMVYYYIQMGFSVFTFDNRGHGNSHRDVKVFESTHIERFSDYVEDLNCFVKDIVVPQSGNTPLYLYSHSMGGAIAVQYLQTYPEVFGKAVLSSPMIMPITMGLPISVASAAASVLCKLGLKAMLLGSSEFNKDRAFEDSSDTSRERFTYAHTKRCNDRHFQNSSPTAGWVKQAAEVSFRNLDKDRNKNIKADILLFQAENDKLVMNDKQDEFVAMVPTAKMIKTEKTKHEIYMSTNDVMEKYLDAIAEFFGD
ncbi:MAG: alpha/beta hydrolase [Clostridia bacterium]|nr:alpha/beta hydrolase [Clostridia bacterium]